ncbi:MAG: helix-turn-helix domain-containing protein [Clostridia bacterium]|nr:helix-turn-helix domain-containing protein [Clostridia bacterium]
MDDLKDVIAANLVRLRSRAGYTQLDVARKLNYSDKAVSKWERAEAVPDIRTLLAISKIYGVTMDELVSEGGGGPLGPRKTSKKKRAFIGALAVAFCFFVAVVIFTILYLIPHTEHYAGCIFTSAFLVAAVTMTALSHAWWGRVVTCVFSSLIIWSAAVLIHVLLYVFLDNPEVMGKVFILYIVAFALQVLDVLWFVFRKVK